MLCIFVCVQIGRTIHCRILRVNLEKFSVDLTCRSSDLADRDNRFRFVQPCVLMCDCLCACVFPLIRVCCDPVSLCYCSVYIRKLVGI